MDVVWSRVVSVCMCVCGCVGFLTGFERMFDDFEDLGMVLNFRKNDLILKTKCMERNWRRVNQRGILNGIFFFSISSVIKCSKIVYFEIQYCDILLD